MFIQKDFEIETVLSKPLMAHLSTVEQEEPRDSPVWFIWEGASLWLFGTSKDSFVKRLAKKPQCAVGIVDFDVHKGILKHIGIRGIAQTMDVDRERLTRFISKYLGEDKKGWNEWFLEHIVNPLNVMVRILPQTIVAKDGSFFKTGPNLAGLE